MVELVEFRFMGPRDDGYEAHELRSVTQMCREILEHEIDDANRVGFACLFVAEGIEPVDEQAEDEVKLFVGLPREGSFPVWT